MRNKVDVGILVASCDKYSDLWQPFFAFWEKYWNDCPFPVYLMANSKRFEGINQIFTLADNWSDELMIVLNKFPHEYLLYIQDDYFLSQKVSNERMNILLNVLHSDYPAYLRIYPHPGKRSGMIHSRYPSLQILEKGKPFITSLQASFWKVDSLKKLLISGENIWDFEVNSSKRTINIQDEFLSVMRQDDKPREERNYPINYFCTVIRKGKWRKDAIIFCKNEGIPLKLERPIENSWDELKKKIYDKVPSKYQESVMKILW